MSAPASEQKSHLDSPKKTAIIYKYNNHLK